MSHWSSARQGSGQIALGALNRGGARSVEVDVSALGLALGTRLAGQLGGAEAALSGGASPSTPGAPRSTCPLEPRPRPGHNPAVGTFLVLGASGFIGAALVDVLSRDPARRVRAVARDAGAARLAGLGGRPNVEVVEIPEWTRPALEAGLSAPHGGHAASFLAFGAGVDPSTRDIEALARTNVELVARVVEALDRPGRVIHLGSCAEYGEVEDGDRVGEGHPVRPLNPYGATKAAGELLGRVLARARGIDFVHARLFGVYGVREPAYRLVPALARALSDGEAVELTPGGQTRDFMFVEDCARALIGLAEAPALAHERYNVCTGVPTTVAAMARTTCRALGAEARLLDFGARPYREGESMWMVGDPSRLEAETGVRPETDLEAGIRRTLTPGSWAPGSAR